MVIDQIRIANLAVEQANRLANLVRHTPLHEKVLVPIPLGEPLPQRSPKQLHQPRLAPVVLVVDVDHLRDVPASGQDLMQRRIGFWGHKCGHLLLGPLATEDGYDGRLARQEGGRVAGGLVCLEERLAVQVRKEER